MHTQYEIQCLLMTVCSLNNSLVWLQTFLFMQEVVDTALVNKVRTSIERNTSLQMLYICIQHVGVETAILKGACGNTTLKNLTIVLSSAQEHHEASAAELRCVRSQLELHLRTT